MIICDKIWSVVTKYEQAWQNFWKIHPSVSTYYLLWQNMTSCTTCIEMSPLMTKPNQGATTCPKMSHLIWQNKKEKTRPGVTKCLQVLPCGEEKDAGFVEQVHVGTAVVQRAGDAVHAVQTYFSNHFYDFFIIFEWFLVQLWCSWCLWFERF